MQPIDLLKLSAEISKVESDKASGSKEISSQLSSAIAEKQRLAIGLLLKQTLQNMSKDGLLSINTQKAIFSAKNILPGEFTQLYIQDRVQQHKLAEALTTLQLKPAPLTPAPLTIGTVNQWFSGQLIQSIVYQGPQNGTALLLVNKTGQFNPAILSQLNPSQLNPSQLNPSQPNLSPITDKLINNEIIKNSQLVQIKTNLTIEPGQQLLLQVNKNSTGVSFELKHTPKESNIISQYINQLVTRQQALPQLIASLKEVASQTNQANTFFTPNFKAQVESVLQQFPQLSQLSTGKEVKNAVNNSGLYLESKILNSTNSTNLTNSTNSTANTLTVSKNITTPTGNTQISSMDLKAGLSRLVTLINNNDAVFIPKPLTSESSVYKNIAFDGLIKSQIRSATFFDVPGNIAHAQVQKVIPESNLFQLNNHLLLQTRILDQLESVLSRIVVTQLQTREGGDQSFLNVEIPFRHNDQQEILQLKIREEFRKKEAEQGNKIWTVNMAFNLQSLGGIRIYITLDKNDLAIQFWTEEKESQQLFKNYFSLLKERLTAADFTISQLTAFHGIPEEAKKEQLKSQFIIDERV